jgi:hypothetical protein
VANVLGTYQDAWDAATTPMRKWLMGQATFEEVEMALGYVLRHDLPLDVGARDRAAVLSITRLREAVERAQAGGMTDIRTLLNEAEGSWVRSGYSVRTLVGDVERKVTRRRTMERIQGDSHADPLGLSSDSTWHGDLGGVQKGVPKTEQVPLDFLEQAREFDRVTEPGLGTDLDYDDLAARGLDEPVILDYDPATQRVLLVEGNNRIVAARRMNKTSVATRVVQGRVPEGKGVKVKGMAPEEGTGYIPSAMSPTQVGVPTELPPPKATQWFWQSNLDRKTCAFCIAMHGTAHPLGVPMESHPNCRCVPSSTPLRQQGWAWLRSQSAATQNAILHRGVAMKMRAGELGPEHIVDYNHRRRYSLRHILGEDQKKVLARRAWRVRNRKVYRRMMKRERGQT